MAELLYDIMNSKSTASDKRFKCYTIEHVEGLFELQFYQGMINEKTRIEFRKDSKECLGPIKAYVQTSRDTKVSLWTLYDYSTEEVKNFAVKVCIDTEDSLKLYLENFLAISFIDILKKDFKVNFISDPGEVLVLTHPLIKSLGE